MIYLNLFLTFAKIGLLGFGGGLAIVQLIYDNIQQFGMITQEQFANIVAISQITPGPLAINVATYIGHEFAGIPGSIVATIAVSIPEFIIVTIVCKMLKQFKDSWAIRGALDGIRPAVIGLIAAAVVTLTVPAVAGESRIGGSLLGNFGANILTSSPVDIIAVLMVALTIVLILKFKKSPIFVLLIMGCIGAILGV